MTAARHIPPPPPSSVRRLPALTEGKGERRSQCRFYGGPDGCLSRFIRATWHAHQGGDGTEPQGHCAAGCESYSAAPPHIAVELAHAFGRAPHPLAGIEGDSDDAQPAEVRRAARAARARGRYAAGRSISGKVAS